MAEEKQELHEQLQVDGWIILNPRLWADRIIIDEKPLPKIARKLTPIPATRMPSATIPLTPGQQAFADDIMFHGPRPSNAGSKKARRGRKGENPPKWPKKLKRGK